jgi:hypothetical protein
MTAIQLHDKYSEDIIGTVLLKEKTKPDEIHEEWDKYQKTHNSNSDNEPDIYEFVANVNSGLWEICEVLELDFYQP